MNSLVIAPHPDDEILGVGGTVANRVRNGGCVHVCICTKGVHSMFDPKVIEQGRAEALIAHELLGVAKTHFIDLPAAEMDKVPLAVAIHKIGEIVQQVQPDEVYIPHIGDIHVDHKIIAEAAMVALRPKSVCKPIRIYSYEVPSETGWDFPISSNAFIPNVFEDISATLGMKLDAVKTYESQAEKWPGARSVEAVEALAKYRGSTVCTDAAEAFFLVREVR